jgi:hypothetical protein
VAEEAAALQTSSPWNGARGCARSVGLGREVMDFAAVVAAIPAGYDGNLMIEVDEPSVESNLESHRISFE